jgi:hypothetical protein
MFDPRFLYLGDTATVTAPAGIDPSSYAPLHQDEQCLDPAHPLTNYCTGRLDGWVRTFTREGFFLSNQDLTLPVDQRPTGPPPTVADWNAFDQEAARRNAAGYIDMVKKNATPSTDFFSSFSRILSNLGHSIETFNVKRALSATQDGLNAIAGQIDKVVPGAGGIVLNYVLGALVPLGPIADGLAGVIANAASSAGQNAVASIARGAGQAANTFFTSNPTNPAPQLDASVQGQIGDSVISSLSAFASSAAADLAPLKGTLLRLSAAYRASNGSLAAQLEAVAAEALKEYIAAVTITAAIVTGGGASAADLALMSAVLAGANAALSVDTALQNATAIKSAASRVKQLAQQQASQLDQEAADLQRQIAALEASNAQASAADQSNLKIFAALVAAVLLGRALS